jgi:xanthine dehydrogenase D subunit
MDGDAAAARRANGAVGSSAARPEGTPKVKGTFAFSSDLHASNMLWGATLRSPHASARILSLDIREALQIPGVFAVMTAKDLPAKPTYGLVQSDQPVLAADVVRFQGDPVSIVAAEDLRTCRRALAAIRVDYEPLEPVTDPELAEAAAPIHPDGNVFRKVVIRKGDPDATGEVIVEGSYELGTQDQAFLGPESGLAVPDGSGGIDLFVATQGPHQDHAQLAPCLGLAPSAVRVHVAGVGGAFGGREDLSIHAHACILALNTGRPMKMSYLRDESFAGHLHRHPARLWYRHHATRSGDLVKVEARILLDGGAYASTSAFVASNAARFACGPYRVANVDVEATCVRTNNHPCGAMRGFGAVQACYGHESQMDKLAAALEMDPVELRLRNVLKTGDRLPTGQKIHVPAPVRECLEAAAAFPLPGPAADNLDGYGLPGGAGRSADPSRIRRGVGFAVGFKNIAYAEGYNDDTRARCRLHRGRATITCAAAELGQGFVTVAGQIARTVLGVEEVELAPASTGAIGSAGSSAASRQTYMSGAAIQRACLEVAERAKDALARSRNIDRGQLKIENGFIVSPDGGICVAIAEASSEPLEAEVHYMHPPTGPLDPKTGQGDSDVSWLFGAQRAVVDVDLDLGLVRVVQVTTGQDVGRALNPISIMGQIEGGISQGLGLAVMEEVISVDGLVKNPSFTDYLIPTFADMPPVEISLIEKPEAGAPFGAKGVGETPSLASTAAVAAAIRAATGLDLPRVPIRPEDIAAASFADGSRRDC